MTEGRIYIWVPMAPDSAEQGGTMEIISPKMDFAFRELMEDDRYHSIYRMRDETGKDYSDLLELHIIELRKTLNGESRMDDWIRLFNAETVVSNKL